MKRGFIRKLFWANFANFKLHHGLSSLEFFNNLCFETLNIVLGNLVQVFYCRYYRCDRVINGPLDKYVSSFPIRISSVNSTKSLVFWEFGSLMENITFCSVYGINIKAAIRDTPSLF